MAVHLQHLQRPLKPNSFIGRLELQLARTAQSGANLACQSRLQHRQAYREREKQRSCCRRESLLVGSIVRVQALWVRTLRTILSTNL